MTSIFLAQTPASAGFAHALRQELHAKDYTVLEYSLLKTDGRDCPASPVE